MAIQVALPTQSDSSATQFGVFIGQFVVHNLPGVFTVFLVLKKKKKKKKTKQNNKNKKLQHATTCNNKKTKNTKQKI